MKDVWLTRNKGKEGFYEIWVGDRPVLSQYDDEWAFPEGGKAIWLKKMCPKWVHRFCKIRLRKGQCVPIKLTHLKNGFKFEVKK